MRKNSIKSIISSKLFQQTGIYTFTSLINSAIPFLLLPILTRYLTTTDYGLVSMFTILVSFSTPFIGLSLPGAIQRVYYDKEEFNIKEYIGNSIYLLLISTFFVSLVFIIFANPISRLTEVPPNMLLYVTIFSFTQFVSRIALTIWRVENMPIKYGLFQNISTLVNALLSILLVVSFNMGWEGRIFGQVYAMIMFGSIALFFLIKGKWISLKYNLKYIKHALLFGLPLIPHAIGTVLINMTDRILITKLIGIDTTGIYAVGHQIGSIINIFAASFNLAFVPWLYMKLKNNKDKDKENIVKLTYIYFVIISIAAIVLSIIAPWFLGFYIGSDFLGSIEFIFWVALGYSFNGMYLMVTNYLFFVQKTSKLALVTITSAIINIPLNYILIKFLGAVGAAISTAIIYFISFIVTWYFASRMYKMPWNLIKIKSV